MNRHESPPLWPLLLFIASATIFGVLAPFILGVVARSVTHGSRSKTVEVVRYVTVEGSAPRPASSAPPASTPRAESAAPIVASPRAGP